MGKKGHESEKMVAISLYRGNLHRVPDIPRRWLMPNPIISPKNFKSLLRRRSKALSTLHNITNPNPNPNPNPNAPPKPQAINTSENVDAAAATSMQNHIQLIRVKEEFSSEREKRRREVEDKLQILNAKKHNLVLALKQILSAEEELRRQSTAQGVVVRPSVPLQGDGTNDNGSMGKQGVPRISADANVGDDVEGVAADNLSNQNTHSRHMLRTSSMSPSSESALRRTPAVQQHAVSHPPRASFGTTPSPSRFAQSGPVNPPSVSVSGTGYIASSPSPAASGGTSVFRDARQPSPWN